LPSTTRIVLAAAIGITAVAATLTYAAMSGHDQRARAQNTAVCWDSSSRPAVSMGAFVQGLTKAGAQDVDAQCVRAESGEYCKGSARLFGQTVQIAVLPSAVVAGSTHGSGGRLYANAIIPVPLPALPTGTPVSVLR